MGGNLLNLLTKYIIATTNFYGVVTPEIVLSIYNQQNEEQIFEEDVREYLLNPPKELAEHFVFVEGGLFVHDSLFIGDDTLIQLIEGKNEKPYYIPEKEELQNYLDSNYIEKNAYFYQLFEFFKARFTNLTEERIEEICENFVFALKDQELNFGFIIFQLNSVGISLEDEEDFGTIIHLVSELGLNVRLWENNGFTRKELFETEIASLLHSAAYQFNANYPCVCGSGELYKDCCIVKDQKVKRLDDYRY